MMKMAAFVKSCRKFLLNRSDQARFEVTHDNIRLQLQSQVGASGLQGLEYLDVGASTLPGH
jgi:hypothetical protein